MIERGRPILRPHRPPSADRHPARSLPGRVHQIRRTEAVAASRVLRGAVRTDVHTSRVGLPGATRRAPCLNLCASATRPTRQRLSPPRGWLPGTPGCDGGDHASAVGGGRSSNATSERKLANADATTVFNSLLYGRHVSFATNAEAVLRPHSDRRGDATRLRPSHKGRYQGRRRYMNTFPGL